MVLPDSGLEVPEGGESDAPSVECAGEVTRAEMAPLDLYIMLDRSASMMEQNASGISKWQAVKTAIAAFTNAPDSEGIGVGIQYFPQRRPEVASSCTSDAECGDAGPCFLKLCAHHLAGSPSRAVPCSAHFECGVANDCVPFGRCSNDVSKLCTNLGAACAGDAGTCTSSSSHCLNELSCDVARYGQPEVAIAALPGSGAALRASLDVQAPSGDTPTRAALEGALAQASAHASAAPERRVAVVLATDGLPTQCAPIDAPTLTNLAESAFERAPSVRTFAVGVFTPELADSGRVLLDLIADAGGSQQAFIVRTDQDVTEQFLAALNEVRQTSLACEFRVPEPTAGNRVDYDHVNVEVLEAGADTPTRLEYVARPEECGQFGGWSYDVDPKTGGTPQTIIVCPSTCRSFESRLGGQVDIRIGCKTRVREPR